MEEQMKTRRRVVWLQIKASSLLMLIFGGVSVPGLYGAHHVLHPEDDAVRTVVGALITVSAALLAKVLATNYYERGLDRLQKEGPGHG